MKEKVSLAPYYLAKMGQNELRVHSIIAFCLKSIVVLYNLRWFLCEKEFLASRPSALTPRPSALTPHPSPFGAHPSPLTSHPKSPEIGQNGVCYLL
jgi:hypothetical protein